MVTSGLNARHSVLLILHGTKLTNKAFKLRAAVIYTPYMPSVYNHNIQVEIAETNQIVRHCQATCVIMGLPASPVNKSHKQ